MIIAITGMVIRLSEYKCSSFFWITDEFPCFFYSDNKKSCNLAFDL